MVIPLPDKNATLANIQFEFGHLPSGAEVGIKGESRKLGIGINDISFEEVTDATLSGALEMNDKINFSGTSSVYDRYFKSGWSNQEDFGRWSDGNSATIEVPVQSTIEGRIGVDLKYNLSPLIMALKRPIQVFVNDIWADTIEPSSTTQRNTILFNKVKGDSHISIRFEFGELPSLSTLSGFKDKRHLGIGMRELGLVSKECTK